MLMPDKTYAKIEELINWEKNPRAIKQHDFKRLIKQIKELGEYKPLIVNSGKYIPTKGEVLGGNMRLRAYQELKLTQCWVSYVDPKTEADKIKYALSDNDRAGYYVDQELAELVIGLGDEIKDFNLKDFAVDLKSDMEDLEDFMKDYMGTDNKSLDEEESDAFGDVDKTVYSKKNTLYQLGRHRLFCGDSLYEPNLQRLFGDDSPTVTITDPPYNVGFNYTSYKDDKTVEEYIKFSRDWFILATKYTSFQVFTPGTVNLLMWANIAPWKSIAPWIKKNAINSGEVTLIRTWEPILFYGKPPKRRSTDYFEYLIGNVAPDMLENGEKVAHTCPKPLLLFIDLVKDFGCQKVFEPFGGSGTTLIACEKTGATCFASEIDPSYCDLIRRRYAMQRGNLENWQAETPEIK